MTIKSKIMPYQMRSNSISQDKSPIQEGNSPVKQKWRIAKKIWDWGSELLKKTPKKEIIKKTKGSKPKVKGKKGGKTNTGKEKDLKGKGTEVSKRVDTKKVDTKKTDTKKVDTKKTDTKTIRRQDVTKTKEYRDLNKKLKEIEDKMKTLSPKEKTIAQKALKYLGKTVNWGFRIGGAIAIADYFLDRMGGEEIEIKDQTLERDLGPQGGDPNNLRLYDPYVGDTVDFSVDEVPPSEIISVD